MSFPLRWSVVPLLIAAAVAAPASATTAPATALPRLHAAATRTSVSGLSSGGFMTVQYGVAFSASVKGLGVVAGGPYNCAYVNVGGIEACMRGVPSGESSWRAAEGFAALGQIDPVANLAKLKVYVFGGTQDSVVQPAVVKATYDFFVAAGVPKANLAYERTLPAGHAFIAPTFGNACQVNAAPYIDRCAVAGHAYDQPRAILEHIYGPLQPAVPTLSATVQAFAQRPFADPTTGMDETGYVYIPKACAADARQCAVHVVFHGCQQGAKTVGDDVYAKLGYNAWADSNRIIVLYPQISATEVPPNPNGCWDWWGFTGLDFQVRRGAQLSAVKAMVDRLTAP